MQLPEGGKIDGRQAVYLNITMILATAILVIPTIAAGPAKQDAWISVTLATLLGMPIAWLTVKLSSLFPGKTLIEYTVDILGRWPGKIVGLLYIFWFVHICSIMIREFGDFLVGVFMPQTPISVFHITVTIMAAYTIKQGLEVLARVNQIFLPIMLFSIILIFLLAIPEMDLNRLLPVFDSTVVDIFKGSLSPLAWMGEIITFAMIMPFLNKPGEAKRVAFISILVAGLVGTFIVIGALSIFGAGVASMTYSVLNMTRVVNITNFLDRLEPLIMVIWVSTGFIKITIFYYVIVLGSARWLKLSDYRPLVMPVGIILVTLSMAFWNNFLELIHFLAHVFPFYALFIFEAGMPLLLLTIVLIRKRGRK